MSERATKGAAMLPLDRAPFTFKTLTAIANTDFVPRELRGKPNSILAAILMGRELGLGPMESMRSIDVIDGRPSPSGEWMVGRIFEAGHVLEVLEQTDEACTVKGIRRDDEGKEITSMEFRFTTDMAKRAGLVNRTNWKNYPEAMLYWRAVAQLARQLFPDVLRGVRHLADELGADQWEAHGYIPEADELAEPEPLADSDDEIEEAEVVEITPVEHWSAEATGKADETAINRVMQYADTDDVWTDLVTTLATYEDWTEKRMEDIEAEVRFIFRAMERLGIWQGDNTLRSELKRAGKEHLSEYKKDGLQSFARNVVMKAQVATREGTDGD